METFPRQTREARIDMEHGFVESIIKNQRKRDGYDTEVKEKLTQPPRRVPAAPRRAERPIYRPPAGRPAPATARAALFQLEYRDSASGAVRLQRFVEGTDLAEFCATFAARAGLDGRLQQALFHRLTRELPTDHSGRLGRTVGCPLGRHLPSAGGRG